MPLNSHAVRVTLNPCSPAWVTHPPTTCPTDAGSMPARLTTSTCAAPRMSGARRPESHPLRFPMGVRTASMITGCAMTDTPPAATPGPRPAAPVGRNLEPVLTLSPALRVGPGSLPGPRRRAPTPSRRTAALVLLEQLAGDDHLLHLVGALVDLRHLRIAQEALDREVLGVAVAAEELHGVDRDRHGGVGGERLGHGAEARELATRVVVDHGAGAVDEGAGSFVAHRHVGQHEAQPLQVGDRGAEGVPLLHVGRRAVDGPLPDADRLRPDGRPAPVQRVHGHGEPLTLLADAVRRRDAHLVEDHLARRTAPHAELVL